MYTPKNKEKFMISFQVFAKDLEDFKEVFPIEEDESISLSYRRAFRLLIKLLKENTAHLEKLAS